MLIQKHNKIITFSLDKLMRIKFFENNIIGEPCWQTASELSNKKYLAEIFSNFSSKKKYWNSGQCDRSRWTDITQQVYGLFSSSRNWKSVLANVNEKMECIRNPSWWKFEYTATRTVFHTDNLYEYPEPVHQQLMLLISKILPF